MGFFTVNRKLIGIKAHYALFNAGCGTVQPTMPVYSKILGFSSFVVGTIYTILPILGLIIKPAFGALADKYKWHRGVLLGCELTVMTVYLGIWFIPPASNVHSSAKLFHQPNGIASLCTSFDHPSYLRLDKGDCSWTCELTKERCLQWGADDHKCSDSSYFQVKIPDAAYYEADSSVQETCLSWGNVSKIEPWRDEGCHGYCQRGKNTREISDQETFNSWQFWIFLLLLVGAWEGTAVITTMSDTVCIEICEDPHLYGKQRLWGSMGWGVLAIINGLVIDAVSVEGEDKNYDPAFYLMIAPFVIDLFVSYNLKFTIPAQSEHIWKDVWKVSLKLRNAVFMLWCAVQGVAIALLWNFVFWLLEDLAMAAGPDVNSRIKTIEGLVAGMQSFVGEVPSFFFGGWLVDKIGHSHAISVIFATVGLRYTLYSLLVNPWWCLPIEILQNNFGFFYSTMTSYAKKIAPPGTEATIQSVLCAICEGIGVAVGSFLGGVIYDAYGGSVCFRIFGIVFFVAAALSELFEFLIKMIERKEDAELKQTA